MFEQLPDVRDYLTLVARLRAARIAQFDPARAEGLHPDDPLFVDEEDGATLPFLRAGFERIRCETEAAVAARASAERAAEKEAGEAKEGKATPGAGINLFKVRISSSNERMCERASERSERARARAKLRKCVWGGQRSHSTIASA